MSGTDRRWLLVGALGVETAPLLELLERPRPVSPRLVVGRLHGREVGVLTCGVGPDKAQARTAAALARWRPDRVVNLGTCGALTDAHRIGDVVHVGEVIGHGPVEALGAPAVALVTVRAGVWDPLTREALAAEGAAVCEMEAQGVLRASELAGVRAHIAKVVSDKAGGEDDPAIPAARRAQARPGPVDVAVFKARALRLSRRHLAPLVDRWLRPD